MAWDQIDTERWLYVPDEPTPDRHLLRYGPLTRLFAEMCRDNLHIYAQPEGVPVDAVWPLNEATWVRSEILDAEPATDEDAWVLLAAAVEVPPEPSP